MSALGFSFYLDVSYICLIPHIKSWASLWSSFLCFSAGHLALILLNLCRHQAQRVQSVEFCLFWLYCMLVCLTIKYYYPSIYVNIPWGAIYVLRTLKILIILVRGHLFCMIFLWSDVAGTVINWRKFCGVASTTWWLGGTDWLSGLETVTWSSRHEHV